MWIRNMTCPLAECPDPPLARPTPIPIPLDMRRAEALGLAHISLLSQTLNKTIAILTSLPYYPYHDNIIACSSKQLANHFPTTTYSRTHPFIITLTQP